MIQVTPEQKMEVINHYQFTGELLSQEPYGSGHINEHFFWYMTLREWDV